MNRLRCYDNIQVNGHSERSSYLNIDEFHDLVELHGKALYGFCYRLTGNKADTDDLYQETFLKAMEVRHKLNKDRNPKGFLIAIAVRLSKNRRRKFAWRQRIAPTSELPETVPQAGASDGAATPEEAVLNLELRTSVQAAADKLDDKLKIPLYMHYTADMSVDEIASALRIPAGTVKSRLFQARKNLKKMLEVNVR